MNYIKIAKYTSWVLLILGCLALVLGFIIGFNTSNAAMVDTLLYFGYIVIALAILAILALAILTGIQVNPKGLLKACIVIVAAVVLVVVVYLIAPGNTPVGYHGVDQARSVLRLTDTILYLTYAGIGVAIVAILYAVIVGAVRK